MSRDPASFPLRFLIAAGAASLLALGLAAVDVEALVPVRVGLILAALVLALRGVNLRLAEAEAGQAERATTAVYLGGGAFVALLTLIASDAAWDSFRLLLGVVVAVGVIGALLLLLPVVARRGVLLLLILVHFGGILTAVFSVAPPNATPCWLTNTLWSVFYRPYLQMMYMNNAYHFYSPEPGPPTLLWFRLEFDKGDPVWVKLPNREDFPTRLQYQRRLALTESTNQNLTPAPRPLFTLALQRRAQTGIPLHPELDPVFQYREPNAYSKLMIRAFARRVATEPEYRGQTDPDAVVKGVKVYRVVHNIIQPKDMARGASPLDETLYTPYYMGDFAWRPEIDPGTGTLVIDPETKRPRLEWRLTDPTDPTLYWLIPYLREPKLAADEPFVPGRKYEMELKDYPGVHAGDRKKP